MRVLSVVHYAAWGGPLNRNARVAPLLEQRGIQTTVLLPDEPGDGAERLRRAGLDVIQIPLQRLRMSYHPRVHVRYFARLASEVGAIRKIVSERKIDLVQVNGLGNPQGAFAARAEGRPLVWQLLDVGYPQVFRSLAMAMVVRMADALMSTGIKVAQAHPGAMSFGERLISFFPPVDVSVFKPDPEIRKAARLELGIGPEDPVIGTVGNINPAKDHASFVRAAAQLKAACPGTRFVILGATLPNRMGMFVELQNLARELGFKLGHDLIVKNPDSRVSILEQAFDVFWLTSKWEGMPTVVEEAMALGLPVVSMDVGAISEAIDNSKDGFIVAPRDIRALVRATVGLVQDPGLRASVGERARRRAQSTFDVSICADSHARAFATAIAHAASRRQVFEHSGP
jgi:glycosyltransferase involved in cell wall biosynthesis